METLSINTKALNMTDEEFFNLCSQNRDLRIERDAYQQIFIMSPTGFITGNRNAEILAQLINWNNNEKKGYISDSSTGFILPSGAMRSPDAAWILKESMDKLSIQEKERFPHICPDFIIEIRSKSDALKELQNKMQEWIDNGCRLGWLIDFENKISYIYKPVQEVTEQSFDKNLNGDDVLPGFELELKVIN